MGYSPLHARCFALFDCLMDKYHHVILAKICPSQHGSHIQQQPSAVQRGDPNAVARSSNSICSKRSSSSSVASSSATRQSTKKMRNNYGTSKQIETAGSIMNQVRLNPNVCHLPIPNTHAWERMEQEASVALYVTGPWVKNCREDS